MKKYVFSVHETEDWNGGTVTSLVICEKSFWIQNGYCSDDHICGTDDELDKVIEELQLEEVMEATFETYLSPDEIKEKLIKSNLFEFDEKFQNFNDSVM